jgi:hypothetical protein
VLELPVIVCVLKVVVEAQVFAQQHRQLGVVFMPTDSVVHNLPVLITAD